MYTGTWTVRSGEQLRLFYARKSVTEQGRLKAEPMAVPMPGMAMPARDTGFDPDKPVASPGWPGPSVGAGWSGPPSNSGFQQVLAAVKAEGFDENKVALVVMAATQRPLSMAELRQVLQEIRFQDHRQALLVSMQFLVTDPANYQVLNDVLPFSAERDLARELWGR